MIRNGTVSQKKRPKGGSGIARHARDPAEFVCVWCEVRRGYDGTFSTSEPVWDAHKNNRRVEENPCIIDNNRRLPITMSDNEMETMNVEEAPAPVKVSHQPEAALPNKTGINERLDEAVRVMPPVNRSADLVPLTRDYDSMRKKLKALIASAKFYKASVLGVDNARMDVSPREGCVSPKISGLNHSHTIFSLLRMHRWSRRSLLFRRNRQSSNRLAILRQRRLPRLPKNLPRTPRATPLNTKRRLLTFALNGNASSPLVSMQASRK